jgi:hypothetical protein
VDTFSVSLSLTSEQLVTFLNTPWFAVTNVTAMIVPVSPPSLRDLAAFERAAAPRKRPFKPRRSKANNTTLYALEGGLVSSRPGLATLIANTTGLTRKADGP